MNNKVNITASGGAVSLGNIVQGDNNQAISTSSPVMNQAFERAESGIRTLASQLGCSDEQLSQVLAHLEALKTEAANPSPVATRGQKILGAIRENFSWAYPLAKDFVTASWPALLALMHP